MTSQGTPITAFILSLIGGVLIFIGGVVSSMWFMSGGYNSWGMMSGSGGMMGGWGAPFGLMGGLSLIGLVAGILVIIGALMLNVRPAEHTAWGLVIVVFSIVSFLGMDGFFIGALLGIAGGALALSCRPISKA